MRKLCFMMLVLGCTGACSRYENHEVKRIVIAGQPSKPVPERVYCSLRDRSGYLWFGTTGAGLYRYDGRSFINFGTADGLGDNYVFSILEDQEGILWFGTRKGICRYDGKNFTEVALPLAKAVSMGIAISGPADTKLFPDEFSAKTVLSMLQDSKGTLWVGTLENGVYQYDGKTFKQSDAYLYHTVPCLLEDRKGDMWMASWSSGGIAVFSDTGYAFFSKRDGLPDNNILCGLKDKKGQLWFGTRSGLCLVKGKTFEYVAGIEGPRKSPVSAIFEDSKGNIWIGTDGSGVYCYARGVFKHFTSTNGLSSNHVYTITEDRAGNICFGGESLSFCHYNGHVFTDFSKAVPGC